MVILFAATLPESRVWTGAAVRRCADRAGLKLGVLAAYMGIDESQLCRQLAGLEHLSVQRLILVDDAVFQAAFRDELAEHFAPLRAEQNPRALAMTALMDSLEKTGRMIKAELESPVSLKKGA